MRSSVRKATLPVFKEHVDEEDLTVWDVEGLQRLLIPVVRFGRGIDTTLFRLMRLAAMFDSIWVPFLLSFGQLNVIGTVIHTTNVFVCDALINSIYACGVIVQLWTSYVVLATGQEHAHPLQIFTYRLTSPTFWADFLSCIGVCFWMRGCYFLAIFRMLRVWRLSPSADDMYELHHAELSSDSPVQNLCTLMFYICLVMHSFACVWFFTATLRDDWEEQFILRLQCDSMGVLEVLTLYAQHMMDGATMLAGWGGPRAKDEDGEYSLAETISWCGLAPFSALVNGLVFVELIEITRQIGASTEKHLERLAELGAVLESLHAPHTLKHRCMKYHCFLSIHNANRKEYESMFDALSQRLQDDIKIHLFDKLVRSAPFFDAIPLDLIQNLVISCEEEVYGPGQTIMRQGEIGSDLYFVMKGSANVFLNEALITTKEVGDYFGEVGLVYDAPRTASICAKSFTIVARLTRSSFVEVLQDATQECREEVTRRILHGCAQKTPNLEKEDTPLLTAEREPSMTEAARVWNRVTEFASSPGRASVPDAGAVDVKTSIEHLEQRLDRLTAIVENGFARLQSKVQPRTSVV